MFLGLWFLFYEMINHPLIFPHPSHVLKAFFSILTESMYLISIGMTFMRLISIIFAISVLAISLGFFMGKHHHAEVFFRPWFTGIKTVPVISIVIIILIIFGPSLAPWIITFMVVFPIIYQATLEGMHHINKDLLDVFYLEHAHFKESIMYVYLPLLKNHIMLSLLQSFSLGLKVLIMAEYFAQTKYSIGRSLFIAKSNIDYAYVFAWTVIIVLCAILLETIIYRVQHHLSD